MLLFVVVCLFLIRSNEAEEVKICINSRLILAAQQMFLANGASIDVSGGALNQELTVVCKSAYKRKTFTNQIRRTTGVYPEEIDRADFETSNEEGTNKISVKCTADGYYPDIFTGVSTWCAQGCTAIPQDSEHNWFISYPASSLSVLAYNAPIFYDIVSKVNISCRKGYAVPNGDTGVTTARCTEDGWTPGFNKFIKCVSGCKDITGDIKKGFANTAASTTVGEAPFKTGDVISWGCLNEFTLSGSDVTTCDARQQWTNAVPTCTKNTGVVVATYNVLLIASTLCCFISHFRF